MGIGKSKQKIVLSPIQPVIPQNKNENQIGKSRSDNQIAQKPIQKVKPYIDEIPPKQFSPSYYGILYKTRYTPTELEKIVDLCEFRMQDIQTKSVLKQESLSYSKQIRGSINRGDENISVFVKMYNWDMVKKIAKNNGLVIEEIITNTVIPSVIESNSPHFPYFYGSKKCFYSLRSPETKVFYESLKLNSEEVVIQNMRDRYGNVVPVQTIQIVERNMIDPTMKESSIVRVTISEDFEGVSMYEFLENTAISIEEKKKVIFQVLWSIMILNQIGINHNDLHLNNILVGETFPEKQFYYQYKLQTQTFTFSLKTRYFAKIIDFDRATWPGVLNNNIFKNDKFYSFFFQERNNILSASDVYKFLKATTDILYKMDPEEFENNWFEFTNFRLGYEKPWSEEVAYFINHPNGYNPFINTPVVTNQIKWDWFQTFYKDFLQYNVMLPKAFSQFDLPVTDLKRALPSLFDVFSIKPTEIPIGSFIYKEVDTQNIEKIKQAAKLKYNTFD